jgi:hapalindole H/12-epi-hapalindole U/12-epi-fischerindole U synthase
MKKYLPRTILFPCTTMLAWLVACDSDPPAGSGGSGSSSASASSTSSSSGESSSSSSSSASSASSSSGESSSSSSSGGGSGGAGGAGGAGPAIAIAVENPGFEANAVADGQYNDKIIPTGWSKYDPNNIIGQNYNSLGVLNPTGTPLYPAGAAEGKNVALIFLWRMQTDGLPAGYSQQLAATLQPKTQYVLRVKVGNIAPEMGVAWDLTGFPGYRVELLAGNTVLAQDDNTLVPAEGTFLESEISFSSNAADPSLGQPLGIRLINLNKANSGIEVNFDDVRLDALPMP